MSLHNHILLSSLLVTAITLIELHGPNGQRYFINPQWVTSIRDPIDSDLKHFPRNTACIVVTTNGKFLAVAETCDVVRAKVAESKPH